MSDHAAAASGPRPLAPEDYKTKPRSLWGDAFRRVRRNPGAMAGLVLLLLVILAAVGRAADHAL